MSELEGYRSVVFWRGRVSHGSYRNYIGALGQFMRWLREYGGALADLDPDGLIEYQKQSDNGSKYDILDLVQTWSQDLRTPEGVDYRTASKKAFYTAMRSFFAHNRAELPRDPYTFRSETEDSEGTLTIEEIRDVALGAKPMHRAVVLSMFQAGLDLEGFDYWNRNGWEDLREALKGKSDVVKIRLPGRKLNRKPYYTFIGGDAIKAIRDYLPTRPDDAEEEAIFYSQQNTPLHRVTLQQWWLDQLQRLGLIERKGGRGQRYGKNLHEMRDVFRSQWDMSPSKASIAEFCLGHKIDKLGYLKSYKNEDWAVGQYRLALPWLQIMSSARPYGLVKLDPKQAIVLDELARLLEDVESMEKFKQWLTELKEE